MVGAGITPIGVDLHTPDFVAIARAYAMAGIRMDTLEALPALLVEAAARPGPTLIEFDQSLVTGG
jgi:acetolactate synthase-1/2/3 large subunit